MEKNKTNKKFGRLVVISLLVVLLMMSAAQAVVKIDMKNIEKISKSTSPLPMAPSKTTTLPGRICSMTQQRLIQRCRTIMKLLVVLSR